MNFASIFIFGYIFFRVIFPRKIHPGWRLLLGVPLFLASFKALILHKLGGENFFAPDLPGFLLILGGYLFALVLFFFILLLIWDLGRGVGLLFLWWKKKFPPKNIRRKWDLYAFSILFGASFLLASLGIYEGVRLPEIKEATIFLPRLSPQNEGMKIALLADIHVDRFTGKKRIKELVKRVNQTKADLILLGGDYVDGPVERCGKDLLPLKELKAPYGVYGVMGNHEYFSGFDEWKKYFASLPIRILYNESHLLPGGLLLAGVTDPAAARYGMEKPDIKKAVGEYAKMKPILLLSHQPKIAKEAAELGVDLQLSGHTHGGMLPLLDLLVAGYNNGFVSGKYRVKDMILYVMNGSGIWNGFPLRLFHPSEITLITLKKGKE